MSESHKETQMTAKYFNAGPPQGESAPLGGAAITRSGKRGGQWFTHPFDARSVMLFASIAVTSAMSHAQPASSSATQRMGNGASSRIVQVERNLNTSDPRRHQVRQPVKKGL